MSLAILKALINDVIANKLYVQSFFSTSNTFRIVDLGCSLGPNTFVAMQNVIEAVEHKYQSKGLESKIPEFQVFFNDHVTNDFNTLFTTLPLEKQYFVAGVPGSFHGRLFPEASLYVVHSSYALHWPSKVPTEVLNKDSPAWNKGKIFYTSGSDEVANAFAAQFAEDMENFLNVRAREIMARRMIILIVPSIANGIRRS
ncbi:Loganic acid O-methyltransferase [Camellia lanceoleosa]|uniref:Loganic acid O-methyltransferase n=1 Tax=Camellia lanceoleosa TaxID=1840588 RepID=A0ACC0FZM5_9ERIC|nr:Loganic acid O-methyltransferase [Camellia lanceoleosa]